MKMNELAQERRGDVIEQCAKVADGQYAAVSQYDERSVFYGSDLNPDRSEFGRGRQAGREDAAKAIRALATQSPDLPAGDGERGEREFRKTATIRATQWWKMGDHPAVMMASDVTGATSENPLPFCPTLEGGHIVTPGDWIATGVQGEHWPIKADVFAATYAPVEQPDGSSFLAEDRTWPECLDPNAAHNRRPRPTPAAGDGELKPDAWLIRETKRGKSSILCAHMFKSEQAATSAAERMTSHWRTCVAVPVTYMLSFDERVAYEERVIAAEMEVIQIKRQTGLQVERLYAFCCAEGGGRPEGCSCVNPDHGTAWFDVPPSGDGK